jgi:hypothetical protein
MPQSWRCAGFLEFKALPLRQVLPLMYSSERLNARSPLTALEMRR